MPRPRSPCLLPRRSVRYPSGSLTDPYPVSFPTRCYSSTKIPCRLSVLPDIPDLPRYILPIRRWTNRSDRRTLPASGSKYKIEALFNALNNNTIISNVYTVQLNPIILSPVCPENPMNQQ